MEDDEELYNSIALLGRQFNKVIDHDGRRTRPNGQNIRFNISKQQDNSQKTEEKKDQTKEVQCFECEGYGHVRSECATYLKRQKKGLSVSWSDEEDSEGEVEAEFGNHVNVFSGKCSSENESCEEVQNYEKRAATYEALYSKSLEFCKIIEDQNKIIKELKARKNTEMLDEIFEKQVLGKPKGIGFDYRTLNKRQKCNGAKFVSAGGIPYITKTMLKHQEEHLNSKVMGRTNLWVCHYCGRKGHIKPFCFKFKGYSKKSQHKPTVTNNKEEWRSKGNIVGLTDQTFESTLSMEDWYFDSGCSKHMTGI